MIVVTFGNVYLCIVVSCFRGQSEADFGGQLLIVVNSFSGQFEVGFGGQLLVVISFWWSVAGIGQS